MITSWRLCNKSHADLSGEGAAMYGGRWNPKGAHVVYSAECLPLATLEALVHLTCRPHNQVCVPIIFDEGLFERVEERYGLPANWKDDMKTTRALGSSWLKAGNRWSFQYRQQSSWIAEIF